MLASSSTDASICLRCHLRQALRQIAPRSRSSFQQCRRYQSTDTPNDGAGQDNGTTRDPPIRKHGGPVRRGGREPRFKQTSAKLPISSMNQETEVIVLRDLPKRKARPAIKPTVAQPEENKFADSPLGVALTAEDIQSFGDKRKQEVQQTEVDLSIDGLNFGEQDAIVSSGQYEAKVGELCRSYNINQMRKYAATHRTTLPLRMPERRFLSVAAPGTSTISITPWTPLDKQKDIPEGKVSKEQLKDTTSKDKRMFAKRRAADDILRNCWGVKVETELAQEGELVIDLGPDQFKLWSNSTSPLVDQVQPSSRFYTNSRLSASAANSTITIKGPRAEAESMADVLRQAFTDSITQRLDLLPLEPLLDGSSSRLDFADIFSSSQLRHVMSLTNTYVRYSREDKNVSMTLTLQDSAFVDTCQLKIKGFIGNDVNDAYRVLMSLLPLPSGSKGVSLMTDQNSTEGRYLVPNPSTKGLPYRYHLQQLGRVIGPVTIRKPSEKKEREELGDVAFIDQDSIVEEVIKKLPSQSVWPENEGIHKRGFFSPYWSPNVRQIPWEAKIGYALQSMDGHGPVKVESSTTSASKKKAGQLSSSEKNDDGTFLPAFPAHLGVLQRLGHVSYIKPSESTSSTRKDRRPPMFLTAKLTPSPFTELGPLASIIFPPIEFRFSEEVHFSSLLPALNPLSEPQITELKFKSMRAILSHETVEVSLPSQPVDLQFSRRTILRSRDAEKDARIAAFVSEIIESERRKEGVIRAPESLRLNIPVNIVATKLARRGQFKARFDKALQQRLDEADGEEMEALYLFSGFEYSERRFVDMGEEDKGVYFSPDHVLRVEHIEGGLTGGKRLQASVVSRRSKEPTLPSARSASPLPLPAITGPTASFAPMSAVKAENEGEQNLVRTSFSLVQLVKGIQAQQIAVKPATQLSVRERAKKRRQQSMQEDRSDEGRFSEDPFGEGRDEVDASGVSAPSTSGENVQEGGVSAADFLKAIGMADNTPVDAVTKSEGEGEIAQQSNDEEMEGGISQQLDEEYDKEDEERNEKEGEASPNP